MQSSRKEMTVAGPVQVTAEAVTRVRFGVYLDDLMHVHDGAARDEVIF